MAKEIIDFEKVYSKEIGEINYILNNLENGRYYENSGAQGDGFLATNITKLRKELNFLMNEIRYGKTTSLDDIESLFK